MQWEMRQIMVEEHSKALLQLLGRVEEEFNRKLVGYKYGQFFSQRITNMVLQTYEINEVIVDQIEELLRLVGLERVAKLVSKVFGVSYRSISELLRLFENFYMEYMRSKVSQIQVSLDSDHPGQSNEVADEGVVPDLEHTNIIKEIEQVLEGRYLVQNRTNSFAKEELAELSKNFQSLARYISQVATDSKMNDVVADEEQLTKFVNSFHMIGTLTKSIEEDLQCNFKSLLFRIFKKNFCAMLERRENEYRASQRNYATQSDTIDGRIGMLQTMIDCLKTDLQRANQLSDHIFRELRQAQTQLTQTKDSLARVTIQGNANKAALDISTKENKRKDLVILELQTKLHETTRSLHSTQINLQQVTQEYKKLKGKAVTRADKDVQTLGKSKNNRSSQTEEDPSSFVYEKEKQMAQERSQEEKPQQSREKTKEKQRQRQRQLREKQEQRQRREKNKQRQQSMMFLSKYKGTKLKISKLQVCELVEPVICTSQGVGQPISIPTHKSVSEILDQHQQSFTSQNQDQVVELPEIKVQSRGSISLRDQSIQCQPLDLESSQQKVPLQTQQLLDTKLELGRQGQNMSMLLSRRQLSTQFLQGEQQAGITKKSILAEKSSRRLENDLVQLLNTCKLGFQEFKGVVRRLFNNNTPAYKINKISQVKRLVDELFQNDSHYLQDFNPARQSKEIQALNDKLAKEKQDRVKQQDALREVRSEMKNLKIQLQMQKETKLEMMAGFKKKQEKIVLGDINKGKLTDLLQVEGSGEQPKPKAKPKDWMFQKIDLELFGGVRQSGQFQAFSALKATSSTRKFRQKMSEVLATHKINDTFLIQTHAQIQYKKKGATSQTTRIGLPKVQGTETFRADGVGLKNVGHNPLGLSEVELQHQLERHNMDRLNQLMDYLNQLRTKDASRFSLINSFLKFPYDCVFNRRLQHSDSDPAVLRTVLQRILKRHDSCGLACPHLQRFQRRIGMKRWQGRKRRVRGGKEPGSGQREESSHVVAE